MYYNHWDDQEFFRLDTLCQAWPPATRFTAFDVFVEDGAYDFFQIMIGTNEGALYYGEIQLDAEEHTLEVENFKKVLQLPDFTPILDVKMAMPTEGWSLVLAITENKLYQFAEETAFAELFAD